MKLPGSANARWFFLVIRRRSHAPITRSTPPVNGYAQSGVYGLFAVFLAASTAAISTSVLLLMR